MYGGASRAVPESHRSLPGETAERSATGGYGGGAVRANAPRHILTGVPAPPLSPHPLLSVVGGGASA